MKTIFISIPWFDPAFRAGGPIQSVANMVNELTGDINYYIFCGDTDLNNVPLENIEKDKWVQYNSITKVWYASAPGRIGQLLKQVKQVRPDQLYIIGIYSWQFNIAPLAFCKSAPKIVSVRGGLFPNALAQKKLKKKIYLTLFRMLGLQRKVVFHATDEAEKKVTQDVMGANVKVMVAGNFPRKADPGTALEKNGSVLKLASIALISQMKNHLLVLKSLEQCKVNIEYDIYGAVKEMQYWQKCQEQIKKMPENVKVTYHGEVFPREVEKYLKLCHVFILPSESENFGHSIYEALSVGKPVITSKFTPWNFLQANKSGLNIDTNVEEIVNGINFFAAMNQEQYNEWCRSAVNFARNSINITTLKAQYEKMFNMNQGK
ncbi:MAG: glycosyltransferase [Bacteroidetes bacterium]|nr:glycosyltransferase [Bacteroidota bacterium]